MFRFGVKVRMFAENAPVTLVRPRRENAYRHYLSHAVSECDIPDKVDGSYRSAGRTKPISYKAGLTVRITFFVNGR